MTKNKKTSKTNSFWQKLKKPILVLAPMEDVTDLGFREAFAKFSKRGFVYFSEFTSADGLVLADEKGKKKISCRLLKSPRQRPFVAQLFSSNPDNMAKAVEYVVENFNVDGIDINMGCPDKTIIKQGAGAALINTPNKAVEIIKAAQSVSAGLPVSVKTRIGFNEIDFDWIKIILQTKPAALTLHLRTKKELSKVPAHWELMSEFVRLKNEISPETILIGNGDITSKSQALEYAKAYNCDGVMIGRGVFGNPAFFAHSEDKRSAQERVFQLFAHVVYFKLLTPKHCKNFASLKKHFKAYITGFPGAVQLRAELMEAKDADEVLAILQNFAKISSWQKFILYTESIGLKALMKLSGKIRL